MRLKAFQVTNYKSILDSGRVEIDPRVTCLMGTAESGKSAVMQALWKFKNVANAAYDSLFDLPAEHYVLLRDKDPEVVVLEYLLEGADKEAFAKEIPSSVSPPEKVKVRSTYKGVTTVEANTKYKPLDYSSVADTVEQAMKAIETTKGTTEEGEPEEGALPEGAAAARTALEALKTAGHPNKLATEIPTNTIGAAIKALSDLPKDTIGEWGVKAIEVLTTFSSSSKMPDLEAKVKEWVLNHLPIFIYFEDYGRLRTRIHLPQFIAWKGDKLPKDPQEKATVRTQKALFEWAKLDADELLRLGQPKQSDENQEMVERRKAERSRILESASYRLTGDWIEWWDQRIHNLFISADGDDLELTVSDEVNPWKIPFGERSRGFQWFFSFYLTFLVESEKAHRGAILLLDEPGLHLHPTSQLKLLNFFQKVAGTNQIIYSSHSLFMVDPDHVDNVRTVYLHPKDPKDPKSRAYTRVASGAEPEGDRATLMPLQAAGAYHLAQTIFLGKRTLIVEGISDYWILNTLNNHLWDQSDGGLHKDIVILWAGGTSHFLPLASIMAAREQMGPNRMAVLLDSDKPGLDKARKLIEMLLHGSEGVLLIGDLLGIPKATTEDIAEASELLEGAKRIGRMPLGSPTPTAGETNVPFLKRIFTENGWGNLTYHEKAKIVLAVVDAWRSGSLTPAAATLERAKEVFEEVNACFERLGADK